MLDYGERGSNRLITHSTSVVTLMRGLGGSLGHVVGHHIKSGTERGANMTELNMMAKHMHAHVDVSGCGLVCRMKSHGNGPLVVHVDVGGARITEPKVLEEHAQVESFFGGFGAGDVLALLRTQKRGAAEFDLPGACRTIQEEDVGAGALVTIGICAPIRVGKTVKH